MSKPYYGPAEDEDTINLERFFLAGDFISGIGYGVQLVLWMSCARYLWKQSRQGKRTGFLLCYITLLLSVETIFAIDQARTVEIIYVDNRNYPGGPWQYFLDTQSQAINVVFYATFFLVTFLCDLLVLWRCWVIWNASSVWNDSGRRTAYLVTVFPGTLLITSFVLGTLWTLQSSHPGLSLYSALPIAYGTAYFAISLSVNIILTILIVARLLMFRRAHMLHLPRAHSKQYLSLATLVIESAALYSIFAIVFLVSYAVNNPINQLWLGVMQAAQQIATYLIIYRVADGTAWTRRTMITITLPTLTLHEGNMAEEGNRSSSGICPVVPSITDSLPKDTNALHLDVESGKAS
ncbi:hypothetical protein C8Q76DRAFT_840916 [Earliella scabrosa]|nr:hypothetical protein C8Q76DRAFT_840916 [Earliella scabrosa]